MFNLLKKVFGNDKQSPEQSLDNLQPSEPASVTQEQLDRAFAPQNIPRNTLQILETFEIVYHTKVPQTLIGRIEFLAEKLDEQSQYFDKYKDVFNQGVLKGIEHYLGMYPDKSIHDVAFVLISRPNLIVRSQIYAICIQRAYLKLYKEQYNELKSMKAENAKRKRVQKLGEANTALHNLLLKYGGKDYPQIEELFSSSSPSLSNELTVSLDDVDEYALVLPEGSLENIKKLMKQ